MKPRLANTFLFSGLNRLEQKTVQFSIHRLLSTIRNQIIRGTHIFFSSESAIEQDKKRGRLVTRAFDENLLRLAIFPLGGTRNPTLILFVTELISTRPTN